MERGIRRAIRKETSRGEEEKIKEGREGEKE